MSAPEIPSMSELDDVAGNPGQAPSEDPEVEDSGRPQVKISNRNPADIAREAAGHLAASNDPPWLFRMGDSAIKLSGDGQLKPLDSDLWLFEASDRIDFMVSKKADSVFVLRPTSPPATAMRLVPTIAVPELPELTGIARSPYLTADGAVVSTDGYDPDSRLILQSGGVALSAVPGDPDPADLHRAGQLLTEDWLGDFPFNGDADRANALALLLTLTGRAFFGLAPLFVVDASTPGAGKGLLVKTICLIATGEPPNLLELPADGDEQRKVITTALLKGDDLIVWDESHVIAGKTMARILTADTYSDRLLGGNKMLTVKNRFTQVAMGNNMQVWGDMKRRVVPVRLVPDCERPEERTGFRHAELDSWVLAHRGELLAAAFTIWRAWIAAGRPDGSVTIGSFERWTRAVGGALDVVGIPGFLGHTHEWLADGDDETPEWEMHLATVREIFGEASFTTEQVVAEVQYGRLLLPYWRKEDMPLARSIGYKYRSIRDRWHGGLRLVNSGAAHDNVKRWRIQTRAEATNSHRRALPISPESSTDRPDASHPSPPSPPGSGDSAVNGHAREDSGVMGDMGAIETFGPYSILDGNAATRRHSGFGGLGADEAPGDQAQPPSPARSRGFGGLR